MERETRKLNTPSGKELEIKTYLNAREKRELRNLYLQGMKTEIGNDGKPAIKELSGEVISKVEDKLVEMAVISYDGNRDNILNRLLDGDAADYEFVMGELNKLQVFQSAK